MDKSDEELHYDSMLRFVKLANELTKEGIPNRVAAAGLMSASCVYATYIEVGNNGTLNESGIERIAAAYKKQLELTQQSRKESNESQAKQSPG